MHDLWSSKWTWYCIYVTLLCSQHISSIRNNITKRNERLDRKRKIDMKTSIFQSTCLYVIFRFIIYTYTIYNLWMLTSATHKIQNNIRESQKNESAEYTNRQVSLMRKLTFQCSLQTRYMTQTRHFDKCSARWRE